MASSHRRYAGWTIARIRQDAAAIGPATSALCDLILDERSHPEQGFRACLGILVTASIPPIVLATTASGGQSDETNSNLRILGRTQALRPKGRLRERLRSSASTNLSAFSVAYSNAEINEKQARSVKYQLTIAPR